MRVFIKSYYQYNHGGRWDLWNSPSMDYLFNTIQNTIEYEVDRDMFRIPDNVRVPGSTWIIPRNSFFIIDDSPIQVGDTVVFNGELGDNFIGKLARITNITDYGNRIYCELIDNPNTNGTIKFSSIHKITENFIQKELTLKEKWRY